MNKKLETFIHSMLSDVFRDQLETFAKTLKST